MIDCARLLQRSALPVLLAAGLACNSSNTDPSSGCTARADGQFRPVGGELYNSVQPSMTNVINGRRDVVWYASLLGDICVAAPEAGNTATFSLFFLTGTPQRVTVSGQATTSIVYQPYTVQLTRFGNYFQGRLDNIGLLQGSADGKHAVVQLSIRLNIPTQGSNAADLAFVQGIVDYLEIDWTFQTLTP